MWQPIETAPKDESPVLLWGRYWSDGQGWMRTAALGRWNAQLERWDACWFHSYPFGVRPTHWQPLPEPPKQDQT